MTPVYAPQHPRPDRVLSVSLEHKRKLVAFSAVYLAVEPLSPVFAVALPPKFRLNYNKPNAVASVLLARFCAPNRALKARLSVASNRVYWAAFKGLSLILSVTKLGPWFASSDCAKRPHHKKRWLPLPKPPHLTCSSATSPNSNRLVSSCCPKARCRSTFRLVPREACWLGVTSR